LYDFIWPDTPVKYWRHPSSAGRTVLLTGSVQKAEEIAMYKGYILTKGELLENVIVVIY
jgi:hypothetical protein